MEHVVDPHITPASWQPSAELAAAATAVLVLAVLGIFAAVMAAAVPSVVLAGLIALAAAVILPVAIRRALHSRD